MKFDKGRKVNNENIRKEIQPRMIQGGYFNVRSLLESTNRGRLYVQSRRPTIIKASCRYIDGILQNQRITQRKILGEMGRGKTSTGQIMRKNIHNIINIILSEKKDLKRG